MAIFDDAWLAAANTLLEHHDTLAVPEFTVKLSVQSPDVPDFCVVAEQSRVEFRREVDQPDCAVSIGPELAARAFDNDDQYLFIQSLLASGTFFLDGDLAKARFFGEGLVRNAPPSLMSSLRAIE